MKINYKEKNIVIPIQDWKHHKLAENNPMMKPLEYQALLDSLSKYGQLEPITLFRNQVLDGRNRLKALKQLGISKIKVDILSHNSSIAVLDFIVNAKETRRMQTKTQLAISAYKDSLEHNLSFAEAARRRGVSATDVRAARDLSSLKPMYIDALSKGLKIKLSTGSVSTSLQLILKDVKKQEIEDLKKAVPEYSFKDRSEKWKNKTKEVWEKVSKELTKEQIEYLKSCLQFNTWEDL